MDRGVYVAMSGAAQTMRAQTIHANNLANINTTGFRSDLAQARSMPVFGEHHPSRVYAMTERPGSDLSSGTLTQTGNPLDIAVAGEGWIAVSGPDGREAYTRAGDLRIDALGQLTTASGLPVLGNGGAIAVPPAQKIQIGADGTLSIVPQGEDGQTLTEVDRIKLVNPDARQLRKEQDGLFRLAAGAVAEADATVRVESGAIERSNVNAVESMSEIITLARQFEMQVKMMKTFEENAAQSTRILQM